MTRNADGSSTPTLETVVAENLYRVETLNAAITELQRLTR
jgi:hypothetical protein